MIDESRLSHLDPETRAALAKAVERIVAVADPAKIILFGSAARGDAKENSDLDLLVVMDREVHRRRSAQAIRREFYKARILRPIDLVVATPTDVALRSDDPWLVLKPALSEGLICYERIH